MFTFCEFIDIALCKGMLAFGICYNAEITKDLLKSITSQIRNSVNVNYCHSFRLQKLTNKNTTPLIAQVARTHSVGQNCITAKTERGGGCHQLSFVVTLISTVVDGIACQHSLWPALVLWSGGKLGWSGRREIDEGGRRRNRH